MEREKTQRQVFHKELSEFESDLGKLEVSVGQLGLVNNQVRVEPKKFRFKNSTEGDQYFMFLERCECPQYSQCLCPHKFNFQITPQENSNLEVGDCQLHYVTEPIKKTHDPSSDQQAVRENKHGTVEPKDETYSRFQVHCSSVKVEPTQRYDPSSHNILEKKVTQIL
jgi:hypothetical protein